LLSLYIELGVTNTTKELFMAVQDPDRASYDATFNYHNALVQMRFSVAAIFMTAAAFLVSAHLGDTKWKGYPVLLPLLGVFITVATWVMELRTRALLANLVENGRKLELSMGVTAGSGFFELMSGPQPIGVKVPFLEREITSSHPLIKRVVRRVFSHGFCLHSLYLSFLLYWLNAAWIAR
jgi:hypothetical protein